MKILGVGTGLSTLTEGNPESLLGSTDSAYLSDEANEGIVSEESSYKSFILRAEETTTGIFGFAGTYYVHGSTTELDSEFLNVYAADGTRLLYIVFGYLGAWMNVYLNIAGTMTQLTSATRPEPESLQRFDLELYLNDTAGYVKIYIEGSEFYTYTGNVALDGKIPSIIYPGKGPNGQYTYWSNCLAADESTLSLRMRQRTLLANSATYNQWDGSYSDVNALASLDTVGMNPTADLDHQAFTISSETSLGNIVGIAVCARANVDVSSSYEAIRLTSVDGDDVVVESEDKELTLTPKSLFHVFYTDNDDAAWTEATLADYAFGVVADNTYTPE